MRASSATPWRPRPLPLLLGLLIGLAVYAVARSFWYPPFLQRFDAALVNFTKKTFRHAAFLPKSPLGPPGLDAAEIAAQHQLESQLLAEQPDCRLTLRNGRRAEGWLVGESTNSFRLREAEGYSGYLDSAYNRAAVTRLERLPPQPVTVTCADVKLHCEFPEFHFLKRAPYSVVTDAPYSDVEKILHLLGELRSQFTNHFAALLGDAPPGNIQVVFFSNEKPFQEYTQRVAPALAGSAGFYSQELRRLVLFNELGSANYAGTQARLTATRQALFKNPDRVADLNDANQRLVQLRSDITSEAKSQTELTIRHEGTHQLVHAYGVLGENIPPAWLSEGLAEYCETPAIGAHHRRLAARVTAARRAGTLLPLETLLDHRDPAGFFALGEAKTAIAYAESWALVKMLMQPESRPAFYEFIRQTRSTETADIATQLATTLHIDPDELESTWQDFLKHL